MVGDEVGGRLDRYEGEEWHHSSERQHGRRAGSSCSISHGRLLAAAWRRSAMSAHARETRATSSEQHSSTAAAQRAARGGQFHFAFCYFWRMFCPFLLGCGTRTPTKAPARIPPLFTKKCCASSAAAATTMAPWPLAAHGVASSCLALPMHEQSGPWGSICFPPSRKD